MLLGFSLFSLFVVVPSGIHLLAFDSGIAPPLLTSGLRSFFSPPSSSCTSVPSISPSVTSLTFHSVACCGLAFAPPACSSFSSSILFSDLSACSCSSSSSSSSFFCASSTLSSSVPSSPREIDKMKRLSSSLSSCYLASGDLTGNVLVWEMKTNTLPRFPTEPNGSQETHEEKLNETTCDVHGSPHPIASAKYGQFSLAYFIISLTVSLDLSVALHSLSGCCVLFP